MRRSGILRLYRLVVGIPLAVALAMLALFLVDFLQDARMREAVDSAVRQVFPTADHDPVNRPTTRIAGEPWIDPPLDVAEPQATALPDPGPVVPADAPETRAETEVAVADPPASAQVVASLATSGLDEAADGLAGELQGPGRDASTVPREAMVRRFASDFFGAWSEEGATAADLVRRFYSETATLDGKHLGAEELARDKELVIRRWPQRSYALRADSLEVQCSDETEECELKGIYDYEFANAAEGESETGTREVEFKVSYASAQPVIVQESTNPPVAAARLIPLQPPMTEPEPPPQEPSSVKTVLPPRAPPRPPMKEAAEVASTGSTKTRGVYASEPRAARPERRVGRVREERPRGPQLPMRLLPDF